MPIARPLIRPLLQQSTGLYLADPLLQSQHVNIAFVTIIIVDSMLPGFYILVGTIDEVQTNRLSNVILHASYMLELVFKYTSVKYFQDESKSRIYTPV